MFQTKLIEIEITADCNAECPDCARTKRGMKLNGNGSLTLADIKHIFPTRDLLTDVTVSLCGVFGDPIVNPECFEICEYLNNMGARVGISTNGGLNSADWWEKLAKLENVTVGFAVDGFRETNHIYRVNTKFNIIERNMRAYTGAGGKGRWIYIVFEHNKHEVDFALELATELGLEFQLRGGGRNATPKQHKPRRGDEVELVGLLNTDLVQKHIEIRDNKEQIQNLLHTIDCRHLNQSYIFIGRNMRLYPCCHLYAAVTAGNTEYINELPEDWNCLQTHGINSILQHDSFTKINEMWSPYHKRYVPRCFEDCGNKGAFQDFDIPVDSDTHIKQLLNK